MKKYVSIYTRRNIQLRWLTKTAYHTGEGGEGGGIRAIWIGTGGGEQSQPNTQFTDRSGNRRSFTEEVFAYSEHVSKSYLLQKLLAGLVPEIFVNVFSLLYPT
jgi:hypothetical protein